ncbi:S8 family peptidase [Jidongwangia harbinensis]|uniref:S8 family peptidase n=1 Tax=Jidongwangia harbinensis TaxID=2878561 RepID=UPI001CD948CF|nr:S8/S53 family peptidase [Jidongwangia harbinensis]MCA2213196.1 S8/S53 family peptidase [Jidongwangia harbinensis]
MSTPPEDPRPDDAYPDPARSAQESQVRYVLNELGDVLEPGPPGWRETGIEYFVRRGYLMVDETFYDEGRRVLTPGRLTGPDDEPPEGGPRDGQRIDGRRWIRLHGDADTFRAMADINDAAGDEVARLEYAVHIASGCCPADEPTPVAPGAAPDPPVSADRTAGAGIRVVVLDTGFDPAAATLSWMRDVQGDPDPGLGAAVLPRYAGHGTFIAGVVRAMAPRAEVIVRQAFGPLGVVMESDLVAALERTLRYDQPDVINLSGGTNVESVRGPSLLNAFYERVFRRYPGVALIAAAGNDNSRRHFWPAAASWATGVGALAPDWRSRAPFSNHGSWVDVYAPGQHLINAFPSGPYVYQEPPRTGTQVQFAGMASWSGTSFAAPVVAGLVAARMSRTGENGPAAVAALLAEARAAAVTGVGAVLVP